MYVSGREPMGRKRLDDSPSHRLVRLHGCVDARFQDLTAVDDCPDIWDCQEGRVLPERVLCYLGGNLCFFFFGCCLEGSSEFLTGSNACGHFGDCTEGRVLPERV